MRLRHALALTGCAIALGSVSAADAQELTVGLAAEPSAADPHYHNLGPNNQLRRHMFESLVGTDDAQALTPQLATSWETVDDTTWRFDLRQDVTFHDGSPFSARDVVYTVCRIPLVENSPSSFTVYTKAIAGMEIEDEHTLIITTDTPYPLLPNEIATWGILSATANGIEGEITFTREGCDGVDEANLPETAAFNSGEAAIGTGPYQLTEYTPGDRIVLSAYDNYWGEQPDFAEVVFRPITSAGPRVAALLAGDVDMIEKPPIQDLARIEGECFKVPQGLSNRVIYLHMDQHGEETPGVSEAEGNPFLDRRVREALSKGINREAIVAQIMNGVAEPAGELLPASLFGAAGLEPTPYSPDEAKALLEEAGYGDGFSLIIGTPNDRYINDARIAQAVAQMFTQLGIETELDALTASQFFAKRNQYEFSMYLAGWGSGTGEMSSPLRALVATPDEERGFGGTNRGRYSNPEMDQVVSEALQTVDDAERERLLGEASRIVMEDYGILPLHFEVTPWALRAELDYTPRTDQFTLAMGVTRAE